MTDEICVGRKLNARRMAYPISGALDIPLHGETLRQRLTDWAEADLAVQNEEGRIEIRVKGSEFVCTFIKPGEVGYDPR